MFTGIVQDLGNVVDIRRKGGITELTVSTSMDIEPSVGESIAVNGVCLTVTSFSRKADGKVEMSFDISDETMKRTNLGEFRRGSLVNLEPALRLSDRIGGHLVSGHIDGVGHIYRKRKAGDSTEVTVKVAPELMRYIVVKGSVAIDGISLTVVETGEDFFSLVIIPHTEKVTTMGMKGPGDTVNVETDIIGKYVEKIMGGSGEEGLVKKLKDGGFM
jgi:riboflavin synthase